MRVFDVLKQKDRGVITTTTGTGITQAMKVLIENQISCLPVLDEEERLVGIISDKDIFLAIHQNTGNFAWMTCGDLMTTDVIIGVEHDDLRYIGSLMTHNRIRHIPIMDGDRLVGLVSVGDVVKMTMDSIEVENRYLKNYITGQYPA